MQVDEMDRDIASMLEWGWVPCFASCSWNKEQKHKKEKVKKRI